tara:strand:+ start:131 stop:1627 length:1497 start_codon:yes stop_codon:yes gene_type:complete
MSTKTPDNASLRHEDTIQFAGDYNLNNIVLIGHSGEAVDIKPLMLELNIYEGIYSNSITGSIVIGDSQNLISKLPIQGTERLSFKISTPGANAETHIIDATEKTGHPFHIYKLTNKQQINPGTVTYVLHFCSREMLRNQRVKVSQSYLSMSTAARNIFKDPRYLDSRKRLYYESAQSNPVVIPNISPFKAFNMMGKHCIPYNELNEGTVGFYFYETTKGFHFRSWQSMVSYKGATPVKPKQVFFYQPKEGGDEAIDDKGNEEDKIVNDYRNVEEYEFINQFHDVAANTALGTYGHRVITHNIYDKTYKVDDYNYHETFNTSSHADSVIGKNNNAEINAIVRSPVDYDDLAVSDYPESRVSLQSTTRFSDDKDVGMYGKEVGRDGVLTGQRIGQAAQVRSGTRLRLLVKGQSYLEAGDKITFNLRNVAADNPDGEDDPQYSGDYIISKIRHRITPEDYKQVLECVKDSVKSRWPGEVSEFPSRASRGTGVTIDIYKEEN